jgi:restriction system protein
LKTHQQIPKFHETLIPILTVLSDGKPMNYSELRLRVRDQFYSHLPDDLIKLRTKSGDPVVLNRIGWGKFFLHQAKMVFLPSRGMVQITEKGLVALAAGKLTLQDVKKDPDYIAYQLQRESIKEAAEVNSTEREDVSPQDMIDSGIDAIERDVKHDLLARLKTMDPYYFEKVIGILLKKMGYGHFQETSKSRDGGIDGVINQDVLGLDKIYIQAKRFEENQVREKDIRNFIGAMSGETSKGVFVTSSTYHDEAVKKAKEAHHKIVLIDGNQLTDLMYQFGIGVQVKNTYEIKELDQDFFIED